MTGSVMREQSSDMRLPKSLDEVSEEWFSAALSRGHPGTAVTRLRVGAVIRGMATKVQFMLEYNEAGRAANLPSSLWLKAGFEAHSARSAPLYAAEVNFFRDIAPCAPIPCPRSYFQEIDSDTGGGILLLEDLTLRKVRFGDQAQPLSADSAAKVLDAQASCHAFLWAEDRQRLFPWLMAGGAIHAVDVVDEFLGFWDIAEHRPRFKHVPGSLRDQHRIRQALRQMEANDRQDPKCLVHGDCHLGNLFFEEDGRPGLIDWQTAMRGHWAFDVSYFLIVSLSVEDRRRHEVDLINQYLDSLGRRGIEKPPFEQAWLSYRQHAMWCFLTALCPIEKQSEDICTLNAERSCAAITDLDSLASLGA
jgi:Phosphotransferase enzyme family